MAGKRGCEVDGIGSFLLKGGNFETAFGGGWKETREGEVGERRRL